MLILGSGWFRGSWGSIEGEVNGVGVYATSNYDGAGQGKGYAAGFGDAIKTAGGLDDDPGKGTGFGQRPYGFQKGMYVRRSDRFWRKL